MTATLPRPALAGRSGRPGWSRPVPAAARRSGYLLVVAVLVGLLALTLVLATAIGPVNVPSGDVVRVLAAHLTGTVDPTTGPSTADLIVWRIRLPRVLIGGVAGAGLALAGTVVQALVRNPIADPYILGLTSGASVGAVVVITTGATVIGALTLPGAAFLGAVGAMVLVFALARQGARLSPLRLILVGVVCSHLFSGITALLLARSNSSTVQQQIIFWMLGGLSGAQWSFLPVPTVTVALGALVILARARRLNALVLGEEASATLGVNTGAFRRQMLVVTTLLTGVVVAVAGGIGFVGLIVPHLARMLVGAEHRRMLPVSVLIGAIFLIWSDVLARIVVAPAELPIGVVTAFLGVPFFLLVMRARQRDLEAM